MPENLSAWTQPGDPAVTLSAPPETAIPEADTIDDLLLSPVCAVLV